eukprot:2345910-Prymnesium_polylepis.1
MEHLMSVQEPNVELGVLTRDDEAAAAAGSSSGGGSSSSYTLQLTDNGAMPPDLPRELSVTLGAAPGTMYVLSESDKGKAPQAKGGAAWRLEGRIEHKGEAKPRQLTAEYKAIVARRVEQANVKRE